MAAPPAAAAAMAAAVRAATLRQRWGEETHAGCGERRRRGAARLLGTRRHTTAGLTILAGCGSDAVGSLKAHRAACRAQGQGSQTQEGLLRVAGRRVRTCRPRAAVGPLWAQQAVLAETAAFTSQAVTLGAAQPPIGPLAVCVSRAPPQCLSRVAEDDGLQKCTAEPRCCPCTAEMQPSAIRADAAGGHP